MCLSSGFSRDLFQHTFGICWAAQFQRTKLIMQMLCRLGETGDTSNKVADRLHFRQVPQGGPLEKGREKRKRELIGRSASLAKNARRRGGTSPEDCGASGKDARIYSQMYDSNISYAQLKANCYARRLPSLVR